MYLCILYFGNILFRFMKSDPAVVPFGFRLSAEPTLEVATPREPPDGRHPGVVYSRPEGDYAPGAGLDTMGIPWGYHWDVVGMITLW